MVPKFRPGVLDSCHAGSRLSTKESQHRAPLLLLASHVIVRGDVDIGIVVVANELPGILRGACQAGQGEDIGGIDVDLNLVKWDARLEIGEARSEA